MIFKNQRRAYILAYVQSPRMQTSMDQSSPKL